MNIPTLETPRLLLRGHRLQDFEACAALWCDPLTTRFIGGRPSTREETWARLQRYIGHWALLGYGFFAVEEKATGAFVGEVGLADFRRDITPPLEWPEAGWVLSPHAHGKGFATEAVLAALDWAASHFGHGRTACLIHPDNAASLRVAAKCGFVETARATYKDGLTVVLQRG